MRTNLFYVLPIKRVERPNDAVIAWLCDPKEGHGVPDFAASIVRSLWGGTFSEVVAKVRPECSVPPYRFDIVVDFATSGLYIENKVNHGALQPGQIENQHRLAAERQNGRPLYHVLLCADHLRAEAFGVESEAFRLLRYSQLAKLLEEAGAKATHPDAAMIVRQYAEYARTEYGTASAARIRAAPREVLAARGLDAAQLVSEEQFTQEVEREAETNGTPELLRQQAILKELLQEADGLVPVFNTVSRARWPFSYEVHVAGTSIKLLRVNANGQMWASWYCLARANRADAEAFYREQLRGMVHKPENKTHTELVPKVAEAPVQWLVELLQAVADRALAAGNIPSTWLKNDTEPEPTEEEGEDH